jgi:hypothetical protein
MPLFDASFSIYYMGINLGAFKLRWCGYLGQRSAGTSASARRGVAWCSASSSTGGRECLGDAGLSGARRLAAEASALKTRATMAALSRWSSSSLSRSVCIRARCRSPPRRWPTPPATLLAIVIVFFAWLFFAAD